MDPLEPVLFEIKSGAALWQLENALKRKAREQKEAELKQLARNPDFKAGNPTDEMEEVVGGTSDVLNQKRNEKREEKEE